MADDVDVHIDAHEVVLLGDTAAAADLVTSVAQGVAADARLHAVRDTGRGAASIQSWPGRDGRGPYTDVSWDRDHFYMSFHEFGTRTIPARPALGPALDRYMHL